MSSRLSHVHVCAMCLASKLKLHDTKFTFFSKYKKLFMLVEVVAVYYLLDNKAEVL
jgi:hypothetical protein